MDSDLLLFADSVFVAGFVLGCMVSGVVVVAFCLLRSISERAA